MTETISMPETVTLHCPNCSSTSFEEINYQTLVYRGGFVKNENGTVAFETRLDRRALGISPATDGPIWCRGCANTWEIRDLLTTEQMVNAESRREQWWHSLLVFLGKDRWYDQEGENTTDRSKVHAVWLFDGSPDTTKEQIGRYFIVQESTNGEFSYWTPANITQLKQDLAEALDQEGDGWSVKRVIDLETGKDMEYTAKQLITIK